MNNKQDLPWHVYRLTEKGWVVHTGFQYRGDGEDLVRTLKKYVPDMQLKVVQNTQALMYH